MIVMIVLASVVHHGFSNLTSTSAAINYRLVACPSETISEFWRLMGEMAKQPVLSLTSEQRQHLTRFAQSRTLPAGDVFKARLILALANGDSCATIQGNLQTNAPTISRWTAHAKIGQ